MTAPTSTSGHDVPGTAVMAVVRWLLLLAVAAVAATTWWSVRPGADEHQQTAQYFCPMHPEVRSNQPGTCPICFMNLEPIPPSGAPEAAAAKEEPVPNDAGHMARADVMLTLERRQAVGIATVRVESSAIARELRLPAVVEVPRSAVSEVRVRAAGFVEHVAPLEIGDVVKPGQALAAIYSPEVLQTQEELLVAQALGSAAGPSAGHAEGPMVEAARKRLELLGVGRGVSDRVLTSGKSLRAIGVSAPRGGVLTARDVSLGGYVTPEATLFQISDLSRLFASATVAPDDVKLLAPKTRGRLHLRSAPPIDVELLLIEPRLAEQTRTATARFAVNNAAGTLLPGDVGEVRVTLPPAEHLVVPRDAVIDVGEQQYVFVERSAGLFSPQPVVAGLTVGEGRVIEAGLSAGTVVVARGAFVLDAESRLQSALAPERPATAPSATPASSAAAPGSAP